MKTNYTVLEPYYYSTSLPAVCAAYMGLYVIFATLSWTKMVVYDIIGEWFMGRDIYKASIYKASYFYGWYFIKTANLSLSIFYFIFFWVLRILLNKFRNILLLNISNWVKFHFVLIFTNFWIWCKFSVVEN